MDNHELAEWLINCAHIEHKSNCKLAASNDFCKNFSGFSPSPTTFHWLHPLQRSTFAQFDFSTK